MLEHRLVAVIIDNSGLILSGSAYFIISYFTPKYSNLYNLKSNLPLGILTSLFLYDGLANVVFFVLCLLLFVLGTYRFSRTVVRKLSVFATVTMFVSGIVGNIYWVILDPLAKEIGQSGVMFALFGIAFMLCIYNLSFLVDDFMNVVKRQNKMEPFDSFISLISAGVAIYLLFMLVFEKSQFLNITQGVAYQIHGLCFMLGISGLILYKHLMLDRNLKISQGSETT